MAPPDVDASARNWLRAWGGFVAARDFASARELFDPAVVGFGTRAEVAEGLDRLEAEQWRHVWPSIEGFAFDVDGAQVYVSEGADQAVLAAQWTSTGATGPRPGRATVVLRRAGAGADADAPWLGVHTHFSLTPVP